MSYLYNTFFYEPLYNALMFMFEFIPWADAGVVVILLTIIVRFMMYPLSKKSVDTQVKMSEISPQIEEIKKKYKEKPEEHARLILAIYKEKGVNPFSGIFVIMVQIPIIFALYQIFLHLPEIKSEAMYSFLNTPDNINTMFLGIIDVSGKSVIMALFASLSTYLQLKVTSRYQKPPEGDSFGENLARNMQNQMKYVFPVLVFFISYSISVAIALYWLTTNLFSVGQEIYIRERMKKPNLS